jgi:hypothetical protein
VGFVGCPVKMTFNIIYQRQNGWYVIWVVRTIGEDTKAERIANYAYKKSAANSMRKMIREWRQWGTSPHRELLEHNGKSFRHFYQYYDAKNG